MDVQRSKHYLNNNKVVIAYTFFLAILPIVSVYYSGIPGLSVGDVGLVLFFVVALFFDKKINKKSLNISILYIGLFSSLVFSFFAICLKQDAQISNIIIRFVRYSFYIFSFLFTSSRLLDVLRLKKCIIMITLIGCVFLVIQFFSFRLLGIAIPGYTHLIPLYSDTYSTRDYTVSSYRPTAFFLEPAHFCRYSVIALCVLLFDNKEIKTKSLIEAIFISICILLSTSSQGYLLLAIIVISFVLSRISKIKNRLIKYASIIAVLVSPLIIYLVLNSSIVSFTIERALSGDINSTTSAAGARLASYSYYSKLPLLFKIIGVGFGSGVVGVEDVWFSGFARFLYGSGILITLIFLFFSIYSVFKSKHASKMILLCFLILFFTDDSFCSYVCVLYYSLTLLVARKTNKKYENIIYSY